MSDVERLSRYLSAGDHALFSADDIGLLRDYFQLNRAEAGQVILTEGDREASMGIIVRGSVEVYKADSRGQIQVIDVLGPGKALGEMALVDDGPRSASARSLEETYFLVLTRESFERLLAEQPTMGIALLLKISRSLSFRLRQAVGKLVEVLDGEVS